MSEAGAAASLPGSSAPEAAHPTDDGALALRRVARGSTFAAVGTAIAAVLGFVLTLVVTHELTTHTAGVFFATTAVFLVMQTFASFGVGAGVVRFIPRLQSLGRPDDVPALIVVALVPVLAFAVIGSVVGWFAAPLIASHVGQGDSAATLAAVRALVLMLLPGAVEIAVVECTRGFGSIRSYVLLQQILVPLSRPVFVFAAIRLGAPLWGVVLAWSIPLVIAVALALRLVHRRLRAIYGKHLPWHRDRLRALSAEYWSFTGARGLASVFDILLTWLDVVIVAAVVSPAQAAIYAAASRFITSGTLVLQALRLALAPELSRALARNQLERASSVYRLATQWVILTSWPLYLAMAIFAPCILRIFGSAYAAGATALSILCLAMLANLAAGNVGTVLLMGGKSRWVLGDKGAALVVNVVGNVVLTTHFGIVGAAIAWAATILVDSALSITQVRYGMRIGGSLRAMGLCAVLAVVCYGLIPLAWRVTGGTSVTATVSALALASAVYVPAVWRLRERVGLSLLISSLRSARVASQPEESRT